MDRTREYNRLYKEMIKVEQEMKKRPGDARRLLVNLYDDKIPQVRLMSACATLAVQPAAARGVLEKLSSSGDYPQTANARGMLRAIDEGRYTAE